LDQTRANQLTGRASIAEIHSNYFENTKEVFARSGPSCRVGALAGVGTRVPPQRDLAPAIPAYLRDNYDWAYLNPRNVHFFDHEWVVSLILWGQHRRLQRAAFAELTPGQRILQPAAVYGDFSAALARHLGSAGDLDITDIAPIQVARCRRKLIGIPQASVRLADARIDSGARYDAACCYFLLHELPDADARHVIDALLASVAPGGKVVFIDYHKPHWAHPLKGLISLIFETLEPFAKKLWRHEIADLATDRGGFSWRKETYFGSFFQKVVAERRR
jgi:ubiquinone/menaquinone biosynthesis C-methylase UbiE